MSISTKTYRVVCLSRAVSPITHAAGSEGNVQIVQREPVRVRGLIRWVPFITGNALRHRMVRAPAALHLVDAMKLSGAMSLEQLDLLFHGGRLTGGAAGRINARFIADLYQLLPVMRLLGGSLPNQIVPSNMLCERGTLVCRENRDRMARLLPSDLDLPLGVLPSAEACVANWQYTRRDVADTQPQLAAEANGDSERDSGQMIFSGQSVIAGSLFLHGFILQNVLTVEVGALLHSLRRWQADGATIGGQGARGHGKLHTQAMILPDVDQEACIAEYEQHVIAHAGECRAFLDTVYAPAAGKPKRGKKRQSLVEGNGDAADDAG